MAGLAMARLQVRGFAAFGGCRFGRLAGLQGAAVRRPSQIQLDNQRGRTAERLQAGEAG